MISSENFALTLYTPLSHVIFCCVDGIIILFILFILGGRKCKCEKQERRKFNKEGANSF